MPITLGDIVFLVFAGLTVLGALMAVSLKNIFHNALSLALSLAGTAGIFVLLKSEFLAVMQILIYAGAISVAIIFAVMVSPPLARPPRERDLTKLSLSLSAAMLVFLTLAFVVLEGDWALLPAVAESEYAVKRIGMLLATHYVLPFELVSVALVVAIIGAVIIARGRPGTASPVGEKKDGP